MITTVETIIARMAPLKRGAMPTDPKRLAANCQNGFEAGGHAQRKLRLSFRDLPAHHPKIHALDISILRAITER